MAFTVSPNNSVIAATSGNTAAGLVDNSGNLWGIVGGQVVEYKTDPSGITITQTIVDTGTNGVSAIAFINGQIWQQATPTWSATPLWWDKTDSGYDGWGTAQANDPLPASADGTVDPATNTVPTPYTNPQANPIVDGQGNVWTITGGQVVENGKVDAGTNNVLELAYKNGVIWQEAKPTWSVTNPLWWAKTGGVGSYDGWTSGPDTGNANGNLIAPVPVYRSWIGGGGNYAFVAGNWLPGNVPEVGDILNMTPGQTINVLGNDLQGDTLVLNGDNSGASPIPPDTINLAGDGIPVNMSLGTGSDGWGEANVNLSANTNWIGGATFEAYGSGITVNAASGAQWSNTNTFVDNSLIVNAPVVGSGSFEVLSSHHQATMEFMHGVSLGQSVDIEGNVAYGGEYGILQVDDPAAFKASVTLGYGQANLMGLTATSYDIKSDILTLYNVNKIVDTVKLSLSTLTANQEYPAVLGVSQMAGYVSIHTDAFSVGTPLPVHS